MSKSKFNEAIVLKAASENKIPIMPLSNDIDPTNFQRQAIQSYVSPQKKQVVSAAIKKNASASLSSKLKPCIVH